MKSISR